MGIFSRLGGIFRRKKADEDLLKDLPTTGPVSPPPSFLPTAESASIENVKARMDLVLTQMDSLRVQLDTLNGRVANIEKMIRELYDMAKSG